MRALQRILKVAMLCVAMSLAGSCGRPAGDSGSEGGGPSSAPGSPHTKTPEQETETVSDANDEVAVITTSAGEMVVEFWPDVAPKTVANFKKLAGESFYDGTAFHRIVKGFMIQGGDPLTKDPSMEMRWGTGGPGYKVPAEFNSRSHESGVISMARSSDPNSAGSQFFICLASVPSLDGQYTAFGRLIRGEEVLQTLGDATTDRSPSGEKSRPVKRQGVESVRIVSRDSLP